MIEKTMKKIIIIVLCIILFVPDVFAALPDFYQQLHESFSESYGDYCRNFEQPKWWQFWKVDCLSKLRKCNYDNDTNYDCQSNIQRKCSRECWDYNMSYLDMSIGFFEESACRCIKNR